MKNKFVLLLAFVTLFGTASAQKSNGADRKWNIGLDAGVNHARHQGKVGLYSVGLNIDYNLSEFVALSLNGGMGSFDFDKHSSAFETKYNAVGLEAALNLSRLFYLDCKNERFIIQGLLGGTTLWHELGVMNNDSKDREGLATAGLRMTYWLSNTIGLTLTGKNHLTFYKQDYEFTGAVSDREIGDHFQELKIGLTFALGKNDKSITRRPATFRQAELNTDNFVTKDQLTDFADANDIKALNDRAKKLEDRIANLENKKPEVISQPTIDPADYLSGIFFPLGSSVAYKDADNAVVQIFNYLNNNSNAKVALTGYTDKTGSESFNKKLSEKRAKYIADLLTKMGISSNRISYKGAGVSTDVKGGSQTNKFNRRVEVKFN